MSSSSLKPSTINYYSYSLYKTHIQKNPILTTQSTFDPKDRERIERNSRTVLKVKTQMEKEGLGLEITELRLGLPSGPSLGDNIKEKKRVFSEINGGGDGNGANTTGDRDDYRKGQAKSQVVGWPPVCSYRRKVNSLSETSKMYVKVSMDGAPFLRKLDLGMHSCYADLAVALEKLFGCFGTGEVLKDADSCEFAPIYEDKDGDWMLVGDVPWEMFLESCKRLRIMKRSDAKGFGILESKGFLKATMKDEPK